MLARTWPTWRISWAYDGIGNLATRVGVHRDVVRNVVLAALTAPPVIADDPSAGCHVLSLRDGAGHVMAYPLRERPRGHLAWLGPALLDHLPRTRTRRLRLPVPPSAGLHVDVPRARVGVWTAGTVPGLAPPLAELWPGWRVEFWGDHYEEQLARCGQALEVPALDVGAAAQRLTEHLRQTGPPGDSRHLGGAQPGRVQ